MISLLMVLEKHTLKERKIFSLYECNLLYLFKEMPMITIDSKLFPIKVIFGSAENVATGYIQFSLSIFSINPKMTN